MSALVAFSVRSAETPVVEDVAVLEDLDERRTLVLVGPAQDLVQVLGLDVDAAGDERGLRAEGQRDRVEGMVEGTRAGWTW